MQCQFYLKVSTEFGQSVSLVIENQSEVSEKETFISMQYLDENCWQTTIDVESSGFLKGDVSYRYVIHQSNGSIATEANASRCIRRKYTTNIGLEIRDEWQTLTIEKKVFSSKAFDILLNNSTDVTVQICNRPTHHFEVIATQLPEGKGICLMGDKSLNNWDANQPILLGYNNGHWSVSLDLNKADFPVEYKFGICDVRSNKLLHFEEGQNRILTAPDHSSKTTIINAAVDLRKYAWKGTGINVQLSSLKSMKSWGVGDFSDIHLLVDWSKQTGIKMIQLLPINDTTATKTTADSYPYSAVSAFALHPMFLNIEQVAKQYDLKLPVHFSKAGKAFNESPSLIYDEVAKLKEMAARWIFDSIRLSFYASSDFKNYLDVHQSWLIPYAAFCVLRDVNGSANYQQWSTHAAYDQQAIQALGEADSEHYSAIAFYYFVQYHLHLQLTAAVNYAHDHGIIMKGDLPIGVGRHSVDTWMNPSIFHMDMQAGAPPDAFAIKGQNWSFPTYNWLAMGAENYTWWRQRLTHMSHYFDATRIDHVLGFFRIWSVPMHAIEGILGYFVPVIPMEQKDFKQAGLHFDEHRWTKPFLPEWLLKQTFGEDYDRIKSVFFKEGQFVSELNTQEKLELYCTIHNFDSAIKAKLFDLLSNVILLRDEKNHSQYHFRIHMHNTSSYQSLDAQSKQALDNLYVKYYFENQNELWYKEAQHKLDAIQQSSNMMICAEDLGMVPPMVEGVLKSREMLALQVQRMPKSSNEQFAHPQHAPYLSVVTPSTHDMSTIRQWWEEDAQVTQHFYNQQLNQAGAAPVHAETWVCKQVIAQHLQSPAMWSVFLMQDVLAMDNLTRNQNIHEERINNPADPHHYWNYRMQLSLDALNQQTSLNKMLSEMIIASGRSENK